MRVWWCVAVAGAFVASGCSVDASQPDAWARAYRNDQGRALVVLEQCRPVTRIMVFDNSVDSGSASFIAWDAGADAARELSSFVIGEPPTGFTVSTPLRDLVGHSYTVIMIGAVDAQGLSGGTNFDMADVPSAAGVRVPTCVGT